MFQVILEHGGVRRVEFSYNREKRETYCFIFDENGETMVSPGLAKCSAKDQFNKNIGRKIALTNAINPYDKSVRQQFWEGYFQARNGKKE